MATYKGKLKQKTANGADILHPETEADVVSYSGSVGGTSVANVKEALDTIISAGVGVTGVKGNDETDYRTGDVNLTPANIGAVPKDRKVNNKELSANISLDYSDVGAIPASDKGAASGVATLDSGSKIPVAQIPDVVMGQLVYGGTVTGVGVATLSTNAKTKLGTSSSSITLTNNTTATTGYAANEGIFYIVSSNGTFASLGLNVGDWLIATGSSWKKIDNTDAVTSVNGNIGAVTLNANNLPYASSSDTNTIKSVVDGKQDALDAQTAYSAKGTTTKVPQITTNALGQVTKIEEKSIAFPDITIGPATGGGNAITAIEVDSSNKHKIKVTKGSTFLTASDITGKIDKSVLTAKGDMYYASAASTPARLGIGSSGQILTVDSSGVPSWKDVPVDTIVKDVDNQDTLTQDEYDAFVNGKLLLRYVGTLSTAAFYPNLIQPSAVFPVAFRGFDNELNENKAAVSTCYYFDFGINLFSVSNNNAKLVLNCMYLSVKESTRQVQAYGAAPYDYASIDCVPTSNNYGNLISSGGVYDALANKADKVSMTAGTYSAVAVNSQGIVTSGGQVVEVIANGATPSVVTGGLFFEKAAS